MKKTILSLLLLFFVAPVFVCAQVDYESEIQPIFNAHCISCHGGQNGVTLSSYAAVMNSVGAQYGTNIVIPNQPGQSPIVDKIEPGPQFGARMPYLSSPLSNSQISLIRAWISEGASQTPTSNEIITELPEGYKLKGNYPNPFNPATTIQFEVPEAGSYTLAVYSLHGALISELAGRTSAGSQSITVNFSNQPSGVYFYKVEVTVSSRKYLLGNGKMSLIK